MRWTEPVELFVHPLTVRLDPSAAGLVRDLEGEVTKTITNSDISFHALRAYQPGDDVRRIDWNVTVHENGCTVTEAQKHIRPLDQFSR